MAYTRNPTWQDYDGTDDTLITAAKLENIEQGGRRFVDGRDVD